MVSAAGEVLFRSIGVLAAEREAGLLAGVSAGDRARFEAVIDHLITALALSDGASEPE